MGCAGAITLDELIALDELMALETDEAFEELLNKDEELLIEEDRLLRAPEELLMTIIGALLDDLDDASKEALLIARLELATLLKELATLVTELATLDARLEDMAELDFFDELTTALDDDEVGAGFPPMLLAVLSPPLPPPPPPHAVKMRDIVKAEAIPPKRAFEFFIGFLCCYKSDI